VYDTPEESDPDYVERGRVGKAPSKELSKSRQEDNLQKYD
jgi:hypothetical protein